MFTAVIVDDDLVSRSVLEEMLSQFETEIRVIASISNANQAISFIKKSSPDIVFLDVEMPEYSGFGLLEHFKNANFMVVFVTSHSKYAIKAIRAEAFDYLLKPISMDELKEVVERISSKINEYSILKRIDNGIESLKNIKTGRRAEAKRIALPTFDGLEFYEVDEILRCGAERAYCSFHLRDGSELLVSRPLRDFEPILEYYQFIRIHKSHMINLNYIQKYVKGRGGYVIMSDGCKLQVSVRRRNELLDQFMSI